MKILGISAFYHDAAAAITEDGKVLAAAQEERFTRIKHDPSFPGNAIRFCLEYAGIGPGELDAVAFYDKPFHYNKTGSRNVAQIVYDQSVGYLKSHFGSYLKH